MTDPAPTMMDLEPHRKRRYTVKGNPPLLSGLLLLLLLVVAMLLGPGLSPYDSAAIDLRGALQTPNSAHWLGTDNLGRDLLTRILVAARLQRTRRL
jgi:peptide/nickel transport system permease protein